MRMFGLELFLSRCQKLKVGLTASKICRLHRTHDGKTKVNRREIDQALHHSISTDFGHQKSYLWSSAMRYIGLGT